MLAAVALYAVALVIAGEQMGRLVFDRLGFGLDQVGDLSPGAVDHIVFVYGVLGAVIVGWTVLLTGIVTGPLRRRERWAWWTVTASTATWFLLDTSMSLVVGQPGHAAFNLLFAIGLGVPLLAIRRQLPTLDERSD